MILANIMQTQRRNFFSVRAFGVDDRISNLKIFFLWRIYKSVSTK